VAIPNGYYNGSLTEVWPYKGFVFCFGFGFGNSGGVVKSVVALGRVPCWRLQANTCLFLGLARMISGFVFYIIIVIINLVWNCVINGVQLKILKKLYFQNYFNILISKINFKNIYIILMYYKQKKFYKNQLL
jgi:hypothetical protein